MAYLLLCTSLIYQFRCPDVPVLSCTVVGPAAAVFLTAVDVSGMFAEARICSGLLF
jgi:hypothetical protein